MKKYIINLSVFLVILIAFFCLNSFDKKENQQDCQNYLVSKNNDCRHVGNGVPNTIIRDYQGCVTNLQPLGTRRPFMIESYTNLLEYYQNNQQNVSKYKAALHQETGK